MLFRKHLTIIEQAKQQQFTAFSSIQPLQLFKAFAKAEFGVFFYKTTKKNLWKCGKALMVPTAKAKNKHTYMHLCEFSAHMQRIVVVLVCVSSSHARRNCIYSCSYSCSYFCRCRCRRRRCSCCGRQCVFVKAFWVGGFKKCINERKMQSSAVQRKRKKWARRKEKQK